MYGSDKAQEAHVGALLTAFPRLLRRASRSDIGFPPGWGAILHDLCAAIDHLLDDGQARRFRVEQVKEKFGVLRFYYSVDRKRAVAVDIVGPDGHFRASAAPRHRQLFPAQEVDDLIAEAEKKSAKTCAACGAPGLLRRQGWYHVACRRCVRQESS
ncbi:hypothetical protein GCM10027034_37500 [Ramlibacter solisilvae]|uniref:Uncharacterized protein n=1 Tax=Ramlibacter tataouinensis TaxID=94132 RepID=A0A127JZV5_9BURK|nr:hypothetical protein [Ramlibacter tataouinensis]AMO23672.1 hypothetical protein UC35_13270 [Ramlibacter tataouinensis]